MEFIFTFAHIPADSIIDEQYQGLAWRYMRPCIKAEPKDIAIMKSTEQRSWQIIHIPVAKISSPNKELFIEELTKLASKMWDSAESLYK